MKKYFLMIIVAVISITLMIIGSILLGMPKIESEFNYEPLGIMLMFIGFSFGITAELVIGLGYEEKNNKI